MYYVMYNRYYILYTIYYTVLYCTMQPKERHLEVRRSGAAGAGRFAAGLKDLIFLGFRHQELCYYIYIYIYIYIV